MNIPYRNLHPIRAGHARAGGRVACTTLRRMLLAAALCCLGVTAAAAQELTAHTPDGRALRVPADLGDGSSLLVIGYSSDSRNQTEPCLRRIDADPQLRAALRTWLVVGLGSVPRPMRGPIAKGIARGLPQALRDRLLVLGEAGDAWKAASGYADADADAAYLLLIDGGRIAWRGQGPCDDATLAALHSRLVAAADASPVP